MRISDILKKFFTFRQASWRLIHLDRQEFVIENRKVMYEDFMQYAWQPVFYNIGDDYDESGKFEGHQEIDKKYWICSN